MKILFLIVCFFFRFLCSGTNIEGVINQYSKVISLGDCANKIIIDSAVFFNENEEVIIMQMKGAIIQNENSSNFGEINTMNGAGNFEVAHIKEITNDTIVFYNDLLNTYDYNGSVQIISYPNYSSANIIGDISCKAWDGNTGGVLAFNCNQGIFVTDSIIIDVSGKGFHGGKKKEADINACFWATSSPNAFYPANSWEGASKGEGFANYTLDRENGKGPQANGGGGGNDHNSGGAGGANYGNGGNGGNNADPGFFACSGYNPGEGGIGHDYSENKALLGGGGGAGHGNNNLSSAGGNGGGIVLLKCRYIVGDTLNIFSKGFNANVTSGGDGAGGGGGGGCVLIDLDILNSQLFIDVSGGNGGSVDDEKVPRCHGPGGGGGGGYVNTFLNSESIRVIQDGGSPGIVTHSTASCNGNSNGAQVGSNGLVTAGFKMPLSSTNGNCGITSSEEITSLPMKVFPSISYNDFNLQIFDSSIEMVLLNTSGKVVQTLKKSTLRFGSRLPPGVYFLVSTTRNKTKATRLIKLR